MFDQTFSPENLKYIFDIENRKGKDLFKELDDPELNLLLTEKRDLRDKMKSIKRSFYDKIIKLDEFKKRLGEIRRKLNAKDKSIDERLLKILTLKDSVIDLVKYPNTIFDVRTDQNGKRIYFIKKDNTLLRLVLKKIQYDLKKLFIITFGNRNDIISQIKTILKFNLPKCVYRYDVSSFYESINQEILFDKIIKNRRITNSTKQFILELFNSFKSKYGLSVGIPRGIGLSAFLSEIYMQDFDKNIKKNDGILYYARYVDDIIIIARNEKSINIDSIINKELNKLKLNLSSTKGKNSICKHVKGSSYMFTFLGYKFLWNGTNLDIEMSKNRFERYKEKIRRLICQYRKDLIQNGKRSEKIARNKLFKCLKFLTSNTRLVNSKKDAMVGIYYSNSHLTKPQETLGALDSYTLCMLKENNLLNNNNTELRFKNISFTSGFINRRFIKSDKKHFGIIYNLRK